MRRENRKYVRRKPLALILICALLIGILPPGQRPVSKAFDLKENAARTSYGINNPSTTSDGVTTWDCVYFGNYPQSDATGETKEPIKWRVLSVDGDDAFLLADKSLDVQTYNDTKTEVTWETCTIRTWLNSTFLNKAFTASEQEAIKDTTVLNENNPHHSYNTEGGADTTDKVYLLSIREVMNPSYGFTSTAGASETRVAENTTYVKFGGEIKSVLMNSGDISRNWWLRSPGYGKPAGSRSSSASRVEYVGSVAMDGAEVNQNYTAVRPVLHLDLSSSNWSQAESVTAEGGEAATATPVPTLPVPTTTPDVTPVPPETTSPVATPATTPDITPAPTETESPVATFVVQNPVVAPLVVSALNIQAEGHEKDEDTTPDKVTGMKLKAKTKAIRASWKKATGISGYQIWISTSKKFKKKRAKTTEKTSLTVKKLKSGKTYFIKIRAYTIKNGKKVYGAWSKAVKKKVK